MKEREKNLENEHIRPKVIREIGYMYIAGDGKKFIDEEEAENYQKTIMALHEKAPELTKEQKKEKILRFVQLGKYDDVLEWILNHIDIFDEMTYAMSDWNDDTFAEEYDMLDKSFWENVNEN